MAPAPSAQDTIGSTAMHPAWEGIAMAVIESCKVPATTSLQKASGIRSMLDFADEGLTTDVGQSSASDAESSSGMSSDEGGRSLGKRCRFGKTPLETVPATPSAGSMLLNSPPGFSRAAMRQTRDACKTQSDPVSQDKQSVSEVPVAASIADSLAPSSATLSRFGETPFGTVPKTPVGRAKWKALEKVFGSPPGLSRAEGRRARDACNGPTTTSASWSTCQEVAKSASPNKEVAAWSACVDSAVKTDRRRGARETLTRMKEEAALLKNLGSSVNIANSGGAEEELALEGDSESAHPAVQCGKVKHGDSVHIDDVLGVSLSASSEEQKCRFDGTSLGTIPSTPLGNQVTVPSPPGLSRKAMRQARDVCKAAASASTSWGTGAGALLSINPSGNPMTPPTQRAARRRAARDAMSLDQGLLVPSMPRNTEMPR